LEQAYQTMLIFLASGSHASKIELTPFLLYDRVALIPACGSAASAGGEESMSSSERRLDTRVSVRVPLRFRVLNNPSAAEETAVSENISQRGVFFWTRVPLRVGTPVELSLRMPQEVAGSVSADVKCVARVVHVQKNVGLGGKSGIGLHIERYEARAAVRERWAS
jgi:hypothetical protein